MSWKQEIAEQYGHEYIFRQMAEEAAELCQACLKMVRVLHHETPVRGIEAQKHLLEEVADVLTMIGILRDATLTDEANVRIDAIRAGKEERMVERMLEGDALDKP